MMADALNGRQMEVDAIAGNAVRIAERLGSGEKVPILRMVWVWVLAEALNGSIRRCSVPGRIHQKAFDS